MEQPTLISPASKPQIPSTEGITTKVFKGSVWTLFGQIFPLIASFVATPFVIRLLGTEQYGVFALINLLLAYLTFADFGMSLASTTFASEAYAKGSEEEEGKVIRTAALIALCSSTAASIFIILLAETIVTDLLKIPLHLQKTAIVSVYITGIILVARVLNSVFNSPQLVRLRMDLNSAINAFFNIAQIFLVPVVIFFGGGITGAILTVMIAAVASLITHIIVSGKLLRKLFESSISRDAVKPLLKFGGTLVLALTASVLLANLEKVILTRYTSVSVFAYYSVAFTLANMVTLFSNSMAQSLVPAFAQLYSSGKNEELQDLYARTITINLVFFAPVAMMLCLVAKPFFTVWAGEDFGQQSTLPFYVLIAGLLFNFSASVSGTIMVASRKTKTSAILYWLELLPYLLLAAFLTYYLGAVGAALAWSFRVMFDAVALFFLVEKLVGVSFNLFEKKIIYLMLSFILLLVPPILINVFDNYSATLAFSAIISLILYAVVVWRKVLSVQEQKLLINYLVKAWRYFNF